MKLDLLMKIVDIFTNMHTIWNNLGNAFKSQAYKNAVNIISKDGIKKNINELNVSKNMKTKMKEIKSTGSLKELAHLRTAYTLKKVPGFSIDFILRLLKTKEDIKDIQTIGLDIPLTRLQTIGLKYKDRLDYELERRLAKKLANKIIKIISPISHKVEIVGSIRRKKLITKDIDLMVVATRAQVKKIITKIQKQKWYVEYLMKGNRKFSFLMHTRENDQLAQIDIRFFDKSSYPYAMIHFTGDSWFNIILRKKAKTMGYKLNEYGLFDRVTNKPIHISPPVTEKKIITHMDISTRYANPECRSKHADKLFRKCDPNRNKINSK